MNIIVVVLSIISILSIFYIIFLQQQLRSINLQLGKRLKEHTRQPISLEMINKELTSLAVNINNCLKAEEKLRLDVLREEKHFKEMIANISHDLRTPLTAIKGYQQLIEKEPLSKQQQSKLKIAKKHVDELGILIEHFFQYTYLLNVDDILKPEKINLTNLIAECIAASVELFEEKQIEADFSQTSPVFVFCDKEAATRIIQNLIRNCVQHSKSNIKIQISATENAVISFKNSVNNSSDIDVTKLFDRFYTGDKARSKSTGLGLSIVQLLAEQMGGSTSAALQKDILEICVELPLYN